MPLFLLPILLLALPVVEIAGFILVGGWIGLWPTLGLVVANALVGLALLRRQGLGALRRIRAETNAGRVPARDVVDGVMIVAAGLLLIVPGFVSDVVGYLLFVPPVRAVIRGYVSRRVVVRTGPGRARPDAPAPARPAPEVVDLSRGDYERRSPDPSSPWKGPHDGNRTLH